MSNEKKTGNLGDLRKVVLPIIRKALPEQIAQDILGVQPMDKPVGKLFTLRTKSDKELLWEAVQEIEAEKIKAEKEQDSKI